MLRRRQTVNKIDKVNLILQELFGFLKRWFWRSVYPQFISKTVRRYKICVLLCCFESMYARYMSFKSALYPAPNFTPSDSATSNGENSFIFKADEGSGEYAD